MINSIAYKSTLLKYSDRGQGQAIVLLHGYLESMAIWGSFAVELEKTHRIIKIDLPGHGESGVLDNAHSMSDMAEAVEYVLSELEIENTFIVGHSMGGYVGLAYLDKYPERVAALCLFHSSPFADTDEKRRNRDREINLIHAGKEQLLFKDHAPKIFAPENAENMADIIKKVGKQLSKTPPKGIIAALYGMRDRVDYSEMLAKTPKPVLYVIGHKDQFIPLDILKEIKFPEKHQILHLKKSGHAGMLEETNEALTGFNKFIQKYLVIDN